MKYKLRIKPRSASILRDKKNVSDNHGRDKTIETKRDRQMKFQCKKCDKGFGTKLLLAKHFRFCVKTRERKRRTGNKKSETSKKMNDAVKKYNLQKKLKRSDNKSRNKL